MSSTVDPDDVSTVQYSTVQYSAVQYSTVQYIATQVARALATSPRTFYSSICLEVASDLHSPPIRAQMTRCILPQETGKVVIKCSSHGIMGTGIPAGGLLRYRK